MTEADIQSLIRISLSDHGLVFRTNAGEFWQGRRVYSQEYRQEVLVDIKKVMGLPKGFSDLLFVGDGKTAFIECKTPTGRPTPEQINFIQHMQRLHHAAGIARSVEDALKIIGR
jgi:hypothetical protein